MVYRINGSPTVHLIFSHFRKTISHSYVSVATKNSKNIQIWIFLPMVSAEINTDKEKDVLLSA